MKKLKLIPPLITLLAGAITSILAYAFGYPFKKALLVLLIVLVVFYVLGVIAMRVISSAPEKKKETEVEEDKVVEKNKETEKGVNE